MTYRFLSYYAAEGGIPYTFAHLKRPEGGSYNWARWCWLRIINAQLWKKRSSKKTSKTFQRLLHPFQGLSTKIMITDSTIIIWIMIEATVFIVLLKHRSQASSPSIAAKHRSQASQPSIVAKHRRQASSPKLWTKQRELYISRNEWHIDFRVIMMFPKY